MNSKIKNYVDVLFNDVPNTRKASELKEEILSNLNEHFEAHLAEGKSENQAYTDSLSDLGDIDELLAGLAPEKELKIKIDEYRKIRAKRYSIALILIFIGFILMAGCIGAGCFAFYNLKGILSIIGIIGFVAFAGAATGLIVYTNMSVPQDIEPFLIKHQGEKHGSTEYRIYKSFIDMYWIYITVIYFIVSFATYAWHITWLIWVASPAIYKSLHIFFDEEDNVKENNKNDN